MLLHRVTPVDPAARAGSPYHPGYVPRSSGQHRIDHPSQYDTLYMATSPAAAIAEAFGRMPRWDDRLLAHPKGFVRQLTTFELPDDRPVLDLNDASTLVRRKLRPSQVVTRDRERTQRWAIDAYDEGRWAGISWWSRYDADWTTCGLWCAPGAGKVTGLRLVGVNSIDASIEPVTTAAAVLGRHWA